MNTSAKTALTLDGYLRREGLSNDAFAALLATELGTEVHRVTVGQYRAHKRIPKRPFMVAIYKVTNCEVRPDSFYDLPDLSPPAEKSDATQLDLVDLAQKSEAA